MFLGVKILNRVSWVYKVLHVSGDTLKPPNKVKGRGVNMSEAEIEIFSQLYFYAGVYLIILAVGGIIIKLTTRDKGKPVFGSKKKATLGVLTLGILSTYLIFTGNALEDITEESKARGIALETTNTQLELNAEEYEIEVAKYKVNNNGIYVTTTENQEVEFGSNSKSNSGKEYGSKLLGNIEVGSIIKYKEYEYLEDLESEDLESEDLKQVIEILEVSKD